MIEVIAEEPGYVQTAAEVELLADQQDALVDYVPKSKAHRLKTLIPRNMAFEIQKALNGLVKVHGNIDNYVRNHLKYVTVEELWKGLAAEQIDAVGLYLNQFDKDQGIIIADQTGIGKGRQAAAVIRHAIYNGYLPIFFTKKPDLFTDLYRDLKSIGAGDMKPFIINTDPDAKIKDAQGNVVFSPLSISSQHSLIVTEKKVSTESSESIEWHKKIGKALPDPVDVPTVTIFDVLDYLPGEYNLILSTYSQIQSASPYKKLWLEKIVSGGVEGSKRYKKVVFILDESHAAGGFDSIIGEWMRAILPKAKSCCYLSATFAKYPEVMPFYAKKTAIQETGQTDIAFVGAMQRGGLALQEIVAANLTECGQLIRRQRSNEGIKVDYIVLDEEPNRSKNRDSVNRIIRLMNEIVSFEQDYITPILSDLHGKAKAEGEYLETKPKGLGVKQSPYFSKVFTIVDQMLFALKVEAVAEQAIRLLNEDKKVVIAFKSTMGSFLNDLNLVSGDSVSKEQLDFAVTLIKGLDSIFGYNYTSIDGVKSKIRIPLEDLPANGVDRYHTILESINNERTGLSISPIDVLINLISSAPKDERLGGGKHKNFRVAEVTGRNQRVVFDGDEATVQSFRTDTEKYFRQFNNGEYDVLLINQTGSTGSSAHASADFKDQRVRAMIIHQFELDINIEVQKRGRINRTGQVVLPEYYYITSDIPAERRLMTMLKAKLKSLDANTTGSQKTNEDTLESPDFLNKYGDAVAWRWIEENPELTERMGWPTYFRTFDKTGNTTLERQPSKEGAIRQLTGRAGLLNVDEQDMLYQELLTRYEAEVKWEKQRGTYDLETEFLKLDAEVKKRFLFQQGSGGQSPFGKDTVREESIVNNLRRPFTKDEIDDLLIEALDGQKPMQRQLELSNEIERNYPLLIEERREKRLTVIRTLQAELQEIESNDNTEPANESKKNHHRTRIQDLIQEKTESLNRLVQELEAVRERILKIIKYFQIGQVVRVPLQGSVFAPWGFFLGIDIAHAKNPYTLGNVVLKFIVADFRKLVEYNLANEQLAAISAIYTESKDLTSDQVLKVNRDWNDLVKEASQRREKRQILTENIVGANAIGLYNRLVKYNTKDGRIRNGILLHRSFGQDEHDHKALLPISGILELLNKLPADEAIVDHQLRIRFERKGQNYFQLFITKSGNFQLHTDAVLRGLIQRQQGQTEDEQAEFVQNASEMTALLHMNHLERFLERLDEFDLKYLGEARELEDWEQENKQEWGDRKSSTKEYRYKLSRPYGQGSNPGVGFSNYEEPSPGYSFGLVVYNRPLTDKEKFNYSLIPQFANAEESYHAWKNAIQPTALGEEFNRLVKDIKSKPAHQGIIALGDFMSNNPHEDGNPEFVFGDYDALALGRAAYEDVIGQLTDIDMLVAQFLIELEYDRNKT